MSLSAVVPFMCYAHPTPLGGACALLGGRRRPDQRAQLSVLALFGPGTSISGSPSAPVVGPTAEGDQPAPVVGPTAGGPRAETMVSQRAAHPRRPYHRAQLSVLELCGPGTSISGSPAAPVVGPTAEGDLQGGMEL